MRSSSWLASWLRKCFVPLKFGNALLCQEKGGLRRKGGGEGLIRHGYNSCPSHVLPSIDSSSQKASVFTLDEVACMADCTAQGCATGSWRISGKAHASLRLGKSQYSCSRTRCIRKAGGNLGHCGWVQKSCLRSRSGLLVRQFRLWRFYA